MSAAEKEVFADRTRPIPKQYGSTTWSDLYIAPDPDKFSQTFVNTSTAFNVSYGSTIDPNQLVYPHRYPNPPSSAGWSAIGIGDNASFYTQFGESRPSPLDKFRDDKASLARVEIDRLQAKFPLFVTRLKELIGIAVDVYPATDIPSATALQRLAEVVEAFGLTSRPTITLTASGAIWLEWSDGDGSRAALSISRDGRVSFGMLLPNNVRPWAKTHSNIAGDIESIASHVKSDQTAAWIFAIR